jgi:protoporphyrinogen oxidase
MDIAIIGAGYAGLSAAYDLVRAGHLVTIYEASDHPGGLAAGFKEPHWDWSVEAYYHHWFQSDKHMLGLINELGLSDKVLYPRPYTVMYYEGKWYPFDSILQALLYPGLGWGINKVRFGLVGLYLRLTNNWKPLEQVTVDEWMRKWAGDKVYSEMWEPLVIGKFSERYAKQVNMAWMWARLKARTTQLGTYQGGFQAFADDFAAILQKMGVRIHLNTPVESITPTSDAKLTVRSGQYDQMTYDKVLATTSPGLLARLAPALPRSYLQGLTELKSMGAVVLTVSLKHQVSEEGYYWFNLPKSEGFPFLALVEHTNYVSPEYFGGEHILYMGDYIDTDHEYFSMSKEELLERFIPAVQRINPKFEPDWIIKSWLHRTAYAQPVPLVNHSKNIPDIQTPVRGLYFASMSQVYPWDRGTNFAVEIGRRAARLMMGAQD